MPPRVGSLPSPRAAEKGPLGGARCVTKADQNIRGRNAIRTTSAVMMAVFTKSLELVMWRFLSLLDFMLER